MSPRVKIRPGKRDRPNEVFDKQRTVRNITNESGDYLLQVIKQMMRLNQKNSGDNPNSPVSRLRKKIEGMEHGNRRR